MENKLFVRPSDPDPNAKPEFDTGNEGVMVPLNLAKTTTEGHIDNIYAKLNNVETGQGILAQKLKELTQLVSDLYAHVGKSQGVKF
jgi:hypothetical protein